MGVEICHISNHNYVCGTLIHYKFGAKPNLSPPGSVSPIGENFRGLKFLQ